MKLFFCVIFSLVLLSCSDKTEIRLIAGKHLQCPCENGRKTICLERDSMNRLRGIYEVEHDSLNGTALTYHDDGSIETSFTYLNDVLQGSATVFWNNGNVATTAKFYHGQKIDWTCWYDSLGRIVTKEYHFISDDGSDLGQLFNYDSLGRIKENFSSYVDYNLTGDMLSLNVVNPRFSGPYQLILRNKDKYEIYTSEQLDLPTKLSLDERILREAHFGELLDCGDTLNSYYCKSFYFPF